MNISLKSSITIRVTDREKTELLKLAEEYQLTLSQFLRLKLISKTGVTIFKTDWKTHNLLGEINHHLRKIGTNINQLARNSNLSMQMGNPMNLQHQKLIEMSELIINISKAVIEIQSKIKNDRQDY